jgi:hypothetical protein
MSEFDFETNIGFTIKSLYGNVVHPDAPELNGQKAVIFKPYILPDIKNKVRNRMFIAFNDDGLKPPLKTWLYTNFPMPSKYEKPMEDPFFEIMAWILSAEKDFATGCRIYDKFGRAKKVKKYFSKGESTARYMKLEHKIRELLNYY